ncbi:MAG: pentapeptide repeat-containing protein [Rhodospirillaceae bacterium]|nr:pentapeptide repeat-containing protein [Rhodospirillaceae bacterium]MBT7647843.1 pentapeptide repeat-containing protein [Rhodospirillaceae bacterium]
MTLQTSNTRRRPCSMTFKTIFGRTAFLAAALALLLTATSQARAACSDHAGPGVDWFQCDYSFWDLTGANLSGASLTGADLTAATVSGANLTNVNLDVAIWTDGRVCAEGSIGGCD